MIKMLIESSRKGSSTSYQEAKQESGDNNNNNNGNNNNKAACTTTSSRSQWAAFRNPRIVRVSRALGGKDRHSKVCTIRGLRDRRIRLSVPTAIQLYDLQDRLGLSQPSKVIDWLIEATKLDIDKLPPLQIPQGCFPHQFPHHDPMMMGTGGGAATLTPHQFSLGGLFDGMNSYQSLLAKGKWIKTNQETSNSYDDQDHGSIGDSSAQKLFPIGTSTNNSNSNNSSSLSSLMNNAMPYNNNNYHNSDQPLTLSQFGGSHGLLFPSQVLDPHHLGNGGSSSGCGNSMQFASSNLPLATPSSVSSSIFTPYYAAPYMANSSAEIGGDYPRQFSNHVQFLNSNSSQVIMPHHHPLIASSSLHSMMNSPVRRVPMPFSSKLLDDSENNNQNHSSQEDDEKE